MPAVDPVLGQILSQIPERDQSALVSRNGITSIDKLLAKKLQIEQRQLDGVCSDVQFTLQVVCTFLGTLDATSTFTWEAFENFCGFHDNSGENITDDWADAKKKKTKETDRDDDPDGLNLTSEERMQLKLNVENDPLTVKIRGFSSRALQFEFDEYDKQKQSEDTSDKTEVAFNGSVYYVNKCYHFQQPNGESVIVGIRKFTSNEKKAICALVVPFAETIMGRGLEEEPPIGVPATYEEDQSGLPSFVQIREKPNSEPVLALSSLKACHEPSQLPELLYERQRVGHPPHNFGFVYEQDGTNRLEEREDIPFLDLFAGSGGFHQGVTRVDGFKGVAAVEYWETACDTFKLNNPETKVFCQKVEDFLEQYASPIDFRKEFGRVPVALCTPPCQSYSGSNRDVDHNGEADLYRKGLSLKFFDAMQVSGALVGVFENVEGMWRKHNVYFLKKIVLDHLRAGYQVRVRLHYADAFGDPQRRPRLLIYVAKKFVEMPLVLETHGPGKHPYITVGNAFTALDRAIAKNTGKPVPNMQGSAASRDERDVLVADRPAGTIRCGGRAWHPTKDRAITPREGAALQSYPIHYEFLGTLTDQYKQVGNAVPGCMAAAVARAIFESLRFVYAEEEEEEGEKEEENKVMETKEPIATKMG